MNKIIIKNKIKIILKRILKIFRSLNQSKYFSQNGQDRFLEEKILHNFPKGYFVDIGANDGITYSNTYFFEKKGWQGLCVEPIPEIFKKLEKNRKCECLCGVISEKNSEYSEFLHVTGYSEMLSGVLDKYETEHLERVEHEIKNYGGKKEIIRVKNYHFNDIVKNVFIDYLSIDVEGSEFDIIKTIDFSKFEIKTISIENPYKNNEMRDFLNNKNFYYLETVGSDEIYINNKYKNFIK